MAVGPRFAGRWSRCARIGRSIDRGLMTTGTHDRAFRLWNDQGAARSITCDGIAMQARCCDVEVHARPVALVAGSLVYA